MMIPADLTALVIVAILALVGLAVGISDATKRAKKQSEYDRDRNHGTDTH